MRRRLGAVAVSLACAGLLAATAGAAEGTRETPRASLLGYLEASRDADYRLAAQYLDLRPIPANRREQRGPKLARELKVVLDRSLWVDVDALSDAPEGQRDDDLPARRDLVGEVATESGPVPIRLERVGNEWLISGSTVSRIPALHAELGYGPLAEYIPAPLLDIHFLELELWQWIGLILALIVAYALASGFALAAARAFAPLLARTETEVDDQLLRMATAPLTATLAISLFYPAALALSLSLPAQRFVGGLCKGLVVVTIAWLAMRLIDVGTEVMRRRMLAAGNAAATSLLPVGRRLAKVFLVALAILSLLSNLDYDVTGLIAGLGIGGLAVALAAQKTFENFLGSMELVADRPVAVGDFCRFGDKVGTVEDIGLRSVRIRTLDRTLVTVPNSEFASLQLENFAERDRIRFYTVLGLRYETTAEQLRFVLVELKKLLVAHPKVHPDPARIRFIGFGAYSLDLEIFSYIETADWPEFLAIREDLLLRIMEVVESTGSGFAFPSQTLYLGGDDGLDETRSRAAEAQVRDWRERRELPLPDPTPESVREATDSLPYPPQGSALATKT
jgi:MscS family membrane protein